MAQELQNSHFVDETIGIIPMIFGLRRPCHSENIFHRKCDTCTFYRTTCCLFVFFSRGFILASAACVDLCLVAISLASLNDTRRRRETTHHKTREIKINKTQDTKHTHTQQPRTKSSRNPPQSTVSKKPDVSLENLFKFPVPFRSLFSWPPSPHARSTTPHSLGTSKT